MARSPSSPRARGAQLASLALALGCACGSAPGAALPGGASSTVTQAAAPVSSLPPPGPRQLGINVGAATLDWDTLRLYADVMKSARPFERPAGGPAQLDEQGWPVEDFKVIVWHGLDRMHGRYTLSFEGKAKVEAQWIRATLGPARYDAATHTTTQTLDVQDAGKGGLLLVFTGTERGAAPGGGVTQLRLLRPTAPGASTSHPPTALFSEAALAYLRRFPVLRVMDLLATNSNQQREWADRPLPAWPSFQRKNDQEGWGWQGVGAPWEHAVQLANELDADLWINLPVRASDEYVRKVATLLRYGSDGREPYLSAQAAPRFPPLEEGRRLYVEYGNELWNSAGAIFGDAYRYNQEQAAAEVASGPSPLAFDGEKNHYYWGWRRVALRGAQVSGIFRQVFGDAAMMTRVRPVLATQQGNAQETLTQALHLLHGYLDNGEGDFVPAPHPPSWYFYGAGGSAYYGPDGGTAGLTLDSLWQSATMSVTSWQEALARDAHRVAALGLRRVAYEGGPSFDKSGNADLVKEAAARDPRLAAAVVEHHRAFEQSGGELLVYYQATGDHQWGFAADVLDARSPRLDGLERLAALPREAPTLGVAVPGAVEGKRFALASLDWARPGAGGQELSAAAGAPGWASYTWRATDSAARTLRLELSHGSADAELVVYWDGAPIGTVAPPRGAARVELTGLPVSPGLHGALVRARRGAFTLERLELR